MSGEKDEQQIDRTGYVHTLDEEYGQERNEPVVPKSVRSPKVVPTHSHY